jgi:hypothetical protein
VSLKGITGDDDDYGDDDDGQSIQLFNVKLLVHHITSRLQKVNTDSSMLTRS